MKILSIILILIFPAAAFAQDTLSLQNAIEKALAGNFDIRLAKKSREAADNSVNIGNAGMLPSVSASGSANVSVTDIDMTIAAGQQPMDINQDGSRTDNYNAGVLLNWTLFDGLAMFTSFDKYKKLQNKSKIEFQNAVEAMIRDLTDAYSNTVRLKKNLAVLQESIQIDMDRIGRIKTKTEFGAAPGIELLNAQVDLNADSAAYLQTEINYRNMKRRLNLIMGISIDEQFILQDIIDFKKIPDFETLKQQAMENNTSINMAFAEEEISELDHDLIIASLYPRISAQASYNYSRQESDGGFMLLNQQKGYSLGLTASWQIFSGFQTKIAAENADIRTEMNSIMTERIRTQIMLTLQNTYDTYLRRKRVLEMEQQNLQTAERNFERSRELYRLGQINSVELRQAQLALQRSENAINNAEFLLKTAETELLLLSGRIMAGD